MALHFLAPSDVDINEWNNIYSLATKIMDDPSQYQDALRGKVLANLFFEPSTRTMFSFQVAMQRLGGTCIGLNDPSISSMMKGENLRDTISVISRYVDVIVMRHPKDGASYAASIFSKVPVINAGDGAHFHPTQALIDLVTIKIKKGSLCGLRIGICGHLSNHRSVLALVKMLSQFGQNSFYLISTPQLGLPEHYKDMLISHGNSVIEIPILEDAISDLDVLYMTRIQRERIYDEEEFQRQKSIYILDTNKMTMANKNLIVMHPLPRVDEISNLIDDDERCVYFDQVEYGMYTRMALLLRILRKEKDNMPPKRIVNTQLSCSNPRCITKNEDLPTLFYKNAQNRSYCQYCDCVTSESDGK